MKNHLLTIVFPLFCLQASAQEIKLDDKEFKVNSTKTFKLPDDRFLYNIFSDKQNGCVLFSFGKESLYIQTYDKALNLTGEKNIDYTSTFSNVSISKVGEKYFWLFSTFDKKKDTESLMVQEIDINSGKLSGEPRELIKDAHMEGNTQPISTFMFFQYTFRNSSDQSKMLIAYKIKSENKSTNKQMGFCVVDQNWNVISNKVVAMPYAKEKMDLWELHVDNNGNAYVSMKVYLDKNRAYEWHLAIPRTLKKDDLPEYAIEVFRLKPGTEELKKMNLQLEPFFYHRPLITDLVNGGLVMGALYTKNPQGEICDGVLIKKIDSEGNVSDFGKGYYDFPPETMKQFISEKEARIDNKEKKAEKSDSDEKKFLLKSIYSNTSGDITLIGESEYKDSYTKLTIRDIMYLQRYDDLIVLKVLSNGNVAWLRKIPKRQGYPVQAGRSSYKPASLSFDHYFDGKNLCLLYSDEEKNMTPNINDAPELYIDKEKPYGYLVYSKIDEAGNVTKAALIDYKSDGFRFFPTKMMTADEKFIVDYGMNADKNFKLVILEKK